MSWLESHQELRDHPKTARLRRRLGVSLPAAIGHLHLLWWWALDYAPTGHLAPYDADVIADAACWEDDPGVFVRALIGAGFVNDDLTIHDWEDYAGRLIETRAANARRKRAARYARRLELADTAYPGRDTAHPADMVPDVSRTSGECLGLPDLTGPNHTGPTGPPPPPPPPPRGGGGPTAAPPGPASISPLRLREIDAGPDGGASRPRAGHGGRSRALGPGSVRADRRLVTRQCREGAGVRAARPSPVRRALPASAAVGGRRRVAACGGEGAGRRRRPGRQQRRHRGGIAMQPEAIHDRRDMVGTLDDVRRMAVLRWARTELVGLTVGTMGGGLTDDERACSDVLVAAIDYLERGELPGKRVVMPRDLAERLLAGLRAAETKAGHLAQKVTHESLGYCGWRSESPRCVEHKALVAELVAAMEER